MLKSQTGPPLGIKNVKVFGISPLSAAILRTFSNWGGPVRAFFGGASLETFSGEAQLKNHPVHVFSLILREMMKRSQIDLNWRKCFHLWWLQQEEARSVRIDLNILIILPTYIHWFILVIVIVNYILYISRIDLNISIFLPSNLHCIYSVEIWFIHIFISSRLSIFREAKSSLEKENKFFGTLLCRNLQLAQQWPL